MDYFVLIIHSVCVNDGTSAKELQGMICVKNVSYDKNGL